jgi:uncharacterized membrane protein
MTTPTDPPEDRRPGRAGDGEPPSAGEPERDEAGSADAASNGAAPDGGDRARPGTKPSGLRNPAAAVRGLGAAALAIEALVLLLAIQPIRVLGGSLSGWAVAAVVGLAVLAGVLAGLTKREWAWHAGTALQGLLLLSGLLHWSLFALGVIFGLVWVYVLHVRRAILG